MEGKSLSLRVRGEEMLLGWTVSRLGTMAAVAAWPRALLLFRADVNNWDLAAGAVRGSEGCTGAIAL